VVADVPPGVSVAGLAEVVDPYMRRILDPVEDPIEVVGEMTNRLLDPPFFQHLEDVGALYVIWAEISDIVDHWPVDYGPDSETIAVRESRQAAQDWLDMPRTMAGLQDFVDRWRKRGMTLPKRYRGKWQIRRKRRSSRWT
jgi:hypothetical protein